MIYLPRVLAALLIGGFLTPAATADAAHRLILQGNGTLAILSADGSIEWQREWGGIHDVHVLENGNVMVQRGPSEVVEIDKETKDVVWSYDSAKENGNEGKKVEVHAFQPLPGGHVMIAETTSQRILEVDRRGAIVKQIPMKVEHPHPHTDTRLARRLPSGNYLVAHEGDGTVREYDGKSGDVVWEYAVPLFGQSPRPGHGPDAFGNQVFCALRMPNGNTLIATGNGHSVLEVSPKKEIVWKLTQNELDGITLAWVTTLEILPNGHYMIGNCHAGPENPLLIELDPKTKRVVWTLDRFADFGNSVSNSQILDPAGPVIR